MASPDSKARVVLGAQWGDEGKGKVIDLLADKVDIVCRCQGGNNAGHTVVVGETKFDLHLLPSGVINENCTAVLGNGVVISLPQLFDEIACNEAKGLKNLKSRLLISSKAHLVFDFHQAVDGLQEKEKGTKSLGTTKKGIGPTYSCKVSRGGIPLSDLLYDFSEFEEKFRDLVKNYLKQFNDLNIDVEKELERYRRYAEEIRGCVTNTVTFLHQSIKKGKSILIEGANGTMLDIDFGTYPYVTSSNSTVGGVITGLGIPPRFIGDVYGVAKAYCTRVGDGPFPTEQNNEIGMILQECGAEIGVTTKRKRRCGWLDMVLLSYSNMINGYTHLAITKLDVLDSFDEVKIGIEYQLDGKTLTEPPANAKALDRVTVNYLNLPGWKKNTSNCRNFSDLPAEAQNYILKIEELCGVSVRWIGVGPERSSIIDRF